MGQRPAAVGPGGSARGGCWGRNLTPAPCPGSPSSARVRDVAIHLFPCQKPSLLTAPGSRGKRPTRTRGRAGDGWAVLGLIPRGTGAGVGTQPQGRGLRSKAERAWSG